MFSVIIKHITDFFYNKDASTFHNQLSLQLTRSYSINCGSQFLDIDTDIFRIQFITISRLVSCFVEQTGVENVIISTLKIHGIWYFYAWRLVRDSGNMANVSCCSYCAGINLCTAAYFRTTARSIAFLILRRLAEIETGLVLDSRSPWRP